MYIAIKKKERKKHSGLPFHSMTAEKKPIIVLGILTQKKVCYINFAPQFVTNGNKRYGIIFGCISDLNTVWYVINFLWDLIT